MTNRDTSALSCKIKTPATLFKRDTDSLWKQKLFILRHGDKIAATALFVLFSVLFYQSIILRWGTLSSPGPGMWPTLATLLGLGFSVLLFILGKDIPKLAEDQSGKRISMYIGVLILLPLLYVILGFVLASFISLALLFHFTGGLNWIKAVFISAISSSFIYILFGILLSLPLEAF